MTTAHWLLLGCLALSLYLTGLIWTIQIVHYPLFALVGDTAFPAYHAAHNVRITAIVMVPMLLELVGAFAMAFVVPPGVPPWVGWLGLALVLVIWGDTALVQVPQHNALASMPSRDIIAALVTGNWLRTLAWTARSLILLGALVAAMHAMTTPPPAP